MVPCFSLFLLLLPQSPSVLAQHRRHAPSFPPRLIALGNHPPGELAVDTTGMVSLACAEAFLRIDGTGSVRSRFLGGAAIAISSDGRCLAGSWSGESGYGEGVWWEVDRWPFGFHEVASGDPGGLRGVENTPQGVVLVGSRWGTPIDIHPPGGWSNLPGSDPWNLGWATAVSADGRRYSGSAYYLPARWVDRVPELLHNPVNHYGAAEGLSPDGANFAGVLDDGRNRPAVWLARDGLMVRTLLDPAGAPLQGSALGVLDDEFVFGEGRRGPQGIEEFGWIWHPDLGTDSVMPMEQWLGQCGLLPVEVLRVSDVVAAGGAYHFALHGRRTGTFTSENWYAQTPRL